MIAIVSNYLAHHSAFESAKMKRIFILLPLSLTKRNGLHLLYRTLYYSPICGIMCAY